MMYQNCNFPLSGSTRCLSIVSPPRTPIEKIFSFLSHRRSLKSSSSDSTSTSPPGAGGGEGKGMKLPFPGTSGDG